MLSILSRFKDEYGNITGYEVEQSGLKFRIGYKELISQASLVDNAIVLSNQRDFRAKSGVKIDTIVEYDDLLLKSLKKRKDSVAHKYIDVNIFRDFSKKFDRHAVYEDLYDNLTNWVDQNCLNEILMQIWDDYMFKRANYKAYIEPGMNARLFMELRRSAVLQFRIGDDFFRAFNNCDTAEEVRATRIKMIQRGTPDYKDEDWQYYYLAMFLFNKEQMQNFLFDYEFCYADGEPSDLTGVDYYSDCAEIAHFGQDFPPLFENMREVYRMKGMNFVIK